MLQHCLCRQKRSAESRIKLSKNSLPSLPGQKKFQSGTDTKTCRLATLLCDVRTRLEQSEVPIASRANRLRGHPVISGANNLARFRDRSMEKLENFSAFQLVRLAAAPHIPRGGAQTSRGGTAVNTNLGKSRKRCASLFRVEERPFQRRRTSFGLLPHSSNPTSETRGVRSSRATGPPDRETVSRHVFGTTSFADLDTTQAEPASSLNRLFTNCPDDILCRFPFFPRPQSLGDR